MESRCPTSVYIGVGRLLDYRWMINDRGYANVVYAPGTDSHVYGHVYRLAPSDERALDRNEGVPFAYTKEILSVELWVLQDNGIPGNVKGRPEKREMLVYIDRKRIEDDRPKEEYIHRMNMGIEDGVKHGIPNEYFDRVLRPVIPAKANNDFKDLAIQQALEFKDEDQES